MANKYLRSRPTTTWAANTAKSLGGRVKSPSTTSVLGVHFECTTAGTTHSTTEPTWNTTVGGTTSDGTVTWTTRGSAAEWQASKAYALGDRVVPTRAFGTAAAKSYVYECTTAGTSGGSQPTWVSTTPDTSTTTDNTATWTCRKPESWDNATIYMDYLTQDTAGAGKMLAGDTVYVSKSHAESSAAPLTIVMPGDSASLNTILCVDDTGDPATPTALATTATVASTGANNVGLQGCAYCYGVSFKVGSGSSGVQLNFISTSTWFWHIEAGTLELVATGANTINIGRSTDNTGNSQKLILTNANLKFSDAIQLFRIAGSTFEWYGGAVQGTMPTNLISGFSPWPANVTVSGVDLSSMGSGKNIVSVTALENGRLDFHGCKLNSAVTLVAGTFAGPSAPTVTFHNCDDTTGNTNYRLHRQSYEGTITQDNTVYLNASDGTTAISHKCVTTANAAFRKPLHLPVIAAWNETTGSQVTATVEIVHDNATALKNDEIWMEIEYLGSSTSPQTSFEYGDRRASELVSAANQDTSSVTWTGTGGFTNLNRQKLVATFTPQKKGLVLIRVHVAKASYTVYVDPKVTFS